ncbi:MAG: HAD hydrolase-like protein, partial [Clostridia bacterium]|nr:HAD hydrolase-like protein [Clostridia bacterium]
HTLALCGHPPLDSVVIVGDRHHDVEGARLNGLETICVLYGFGDRAELEQAGAAAIAETVADLRKILLG